MTRRRSCARCMTQLPICMTDPKYAQPIAQLLPSVSSGMALYEELALQDLHDAAALLRPLYDSTSDLHDGPEVRAAHRAAAAERELGHGALRGAGASGSA